MKVSFNWLKDLLKLKQTPKQLAEILTMYFAETTVKSLGKRPILEVELLSNQIGWASGHLSLAREISACLNQRFNSPEPVFKEDKKNSINDLLSLDIKTINCRYYAARILQGVKVKESPLWLKQRLKDCGIRPINNLVDVANYVMIETGQPLHVFDFDTIDPENSKKKIIIRQAKDKEILNALDDQKYLLNKEMMVIADSKMPIALAGIKGGQETAVSKKTQNIILESANFKGSNIRLTSKSLGLATDASWRFEHNVPLELTSYALDRLAELIQQIAGGNIIKGRVEKIKDINSWKSVKKPISIKWEDWEKFLGWSIKKERILKNLDLLGFSFTKHKNHLLVIQPRFRNDILIKEDVMGEVARLEGIDLIEPILPKEELKPPTKNEFWLFREKIKDQFKEYRLYETYNYSFISNKDKNILPQQWQQKMIEIENPTSSLTQYLRPTLLINLLKNARDNFRFVDKIRFFELGNIYFPKKEEYVFSGILAQKTNLDNNQLFYQAKGMIEDLLIILGINQHDCIFQDLKKTEYSDLLEQGAGIFINQKLIGALGKPQDFLKKHYDCQGETMFWEIKLRPLFDLAKKEKEFQALPKYPAVIRDISFVISKDILIGEIFIILQNTSSSFLKEIDLFDVYMGKNLPLGSKSLSFHLVFRSPKHTLTNIEIDKEMEKIYKALKSLGAKIR
jgi:phenylalanyl-tRNA synthetase beta chain